VTRFAISLTLVGVFTAAAIAQDKPAVQTGTILEILVDALSPANAPAKAAVETTHEQVKAIAVKGTVAGNSLQTLCLDGNGNIVALVAPARYGNKPASPSSEVQVFSPAGEPIRKWTINFTGQSINAGPEGSVLVAGDGRLAKFDKSGKAITESELPQITALLKDSDKLRKQAKEQLDQEIEQYAEMAKQFKDQQETLKKKDTDGKISKAEKAQLQNLDQYVKMYSQMAEQQKKRSVDDVVRDLTSRLRIINALAVTDKDVFVVCGATKGHGYAVWRMSHDLQNPKEIIPSVMGCCGQMDIQARGDDLFVAENCSHAVGHYDRDGKKLASFGKKGEDNLKPECFGGCCNPMNVRVAADGSVYTAESEGFVKLFNPKGEFTCCVAAAKIQGGCKNVALAVSPDGEKVYFCDQPGSQILVLTKKSANKAAQ
jgi:hypothetical protein